MQLLWQNQWRISQEVHCIYTNHYTIKKINKGRKFISNEVAELLATDLYHNIEKDPHEYLSDREFEILKMIAIVMSTKNIALELSISPKTVSTYRSRILEKLNMKNNSVLYRKPTIYSKPIAKLEVGRLVLIKKCKEKWCKITSGNFSGWIKKNYLWGKIN